MTLGKILSAAEAAERFRVSTRTIIRAGRKAGVCAYIGGKYLFREDDLDKIWEAHLSDSGNPRVRRIERSEIMKLSYADVKKRANAFLSRKK